MARPDELGSGSKPVRGGGEVAFGTATPTLEELAREPEKAQGLPRHAAAQLHAQAVRALAALEPVLLAPEPERPREEERLLSLSEASRRLGVSAKWILRHRDELPFLVRLGRRVLASRTRLESFLRNKTAKPY